MEANTSNKRNGGNGCASGTPGEQLKHSSCKALQDAGQHCWVNWPESGKPRLREVRATPRSASSASSEFTEPGSV